MVEPMLDLFGPVPEGRADVPTEGPTRAAALSRIKPQPASPLLQPQALAVQHLWLGCSSWSFEGWQGLVYAKDHETQGLAPLTESTLAKHGLAAYSAHPLLNAVGIDRSFYAPVPMADYTLYREQTPESFRFLAKAPDAVTGSQNRAGALNPTHLDPALAIRSFIEPALGGLKHKLSALVFQFSPLPRPWVRDTAHWLARLNTFLAALPDLPESTCYAVEVRDPELITPRLMKILASHRATYCLAGHARLPSMQRQIQAWQMLQSLAPTPLIARWTLLPGLGYRQAKARFFPFQTLQVPDPATRSVLAQACVGAIRAGRTALVIINNKAEGSAPLSVQALQAEIAHHINA
jgi:uncharacterized protein YecE (DUF72 family)